MHALTGVPLNLFRTARALRLFELWRWYRYHIRGTILAIVPWYDPFDAGHLCVAIAPKVADDPRAHILLREDDFDDWVDEKTRSIAGYDPRACFRRFRSEMTAGRRRSNFTSGSPHVSFFTQAEPNGAVSLWVIDRGPTTRTLTIGQLFKLRDLLSEAPRIDESVMDRYEKVARSRDWPLPDPYSVGAVTDSLES